jgi:TolB-like protein
VNLADTCHVPPVDAQPSAEAVQNQLGRLLASAMFSNADRMSRFLRYVVERTLAGEADRLKEYAIGVDVFDRDDQYDPRVDSIVRVEAARLRSKVEEYYSRVGLDDPVVIRLRRGSYVPVFELRAAAATAEPRASGPSETVAAKTRRGPFSLGLLAALTIVATVAWRTGLWTGDRTADVTIAVLPLVQYSDVKADELLAARLTDGITTELARIGTLHVVSHTSARQFAGIRRPLREIARTLNADLIVEGSITTKVDNLHVSARIVDGATDQKIWVKDFEGSTSQLPELQRSIAAAIAATLATR